MPWPGEAAVDVCMVNWVRGACDGPHGLVVDGRKYLRDQIATHLQLHADVAGTQAIAANRGGTAMGVIFGSDAFTSTSPPGLFPQELFEAPFVRPIATGTMMLTGRMALRPDYCIHLGGCETEREAARVSGASFTHVRRMLHSEICAKEKTYPGWSSRWWQPLRPQVDFFTSLSSLKRYAACSNPQARPIFAFLSTAFVPTNTMQVFAFDDDYSFGIIQSGLHWAWLEAKGGRVRGGGDLRYTANVWRTFPWPQAPRESAVLSVAESARALRQTRRDLMDANGWSLRALYQASEVPGPHPLKDAQARLDEAVAAAYDMPAGQEPLEFLLELNLSVAEDEQAGHPVLGPGLPPTLDPRDLRWHSDDCIEPPPLDNGAADA